ncbi:MAG TPA: hypothetical protein ENG51_23170 [Deltaproteobacteria bacterium]|nr:hypothetical protein [Deltaproteobacteria bacterium]
MDKKKAKRLLKFLSYVLCHSPDEFGIFLDGDGSISIKELLWAVKEEDGWSYMRESHLKDLILLGFDPPYRLEGKKIVLNDSIKKPYYPVEQPPRTLFYAARLKACYHIYNHGLKAAGRPFLPLCRTKELALRIGKRRDKSPLLLEINAEEAFLEGIIFRAHGENMFLAEEIPSRFISGPPLPEREVKKTKEKKLKKPKEIEAVPEALPGSFFLDLERDPDVARKKERDRKRRKGPAWKREARKIRKKKRGL